MFVIADANTRLGAPVLGLYVPDDWRTWVTNTGVRQRIDYVVFPSRLTAQVMRASISASFDLLTRCPGHRPVAVTIRYTSSRIRSPPSLRASALNMRFARDSEASYRFVSVGASMPPIPWGIGAAEHCSRLQEHIPQSVAPPNIPWLLSGAWALIDLCGAARAFLRWYVAAVNAVPVGRLLVIRVLGDETAFAVIASIPTLPSTALHDLDQHFLSVASLQECCVPTHLGLPVAESHLHRRVRLGARADILTTHRGSKPGDPKGGIVFSFLMLLNLGITHNVLAQHGLTAPVSCTSSAWEHAPDGPMEVCQLVDLPYADDTLFGLGVDSPVGVYTQLPLAVSMVRTHFVDCQMDLIPGRGRTEAIIVACRSASRSLMKELARPSSGLVLADGSDDTVLLTLRFQHSGGVVDHDGRILVDLRRRAAWAFDSFRKVWTQISSRRLPLCARLLPIFAHVQSTLLYTCVTCSRPTYSLVAVLARPHLGDSWCAHLCPLAGAVYQ